MDKEKINKRCMGRRGTERHIIKKVDCEEKKKEEKKNSDSHLNEREENASKKESKNDNG